MLFNPIRGCSLPVVLNPDIRVRVNYIESTAGGSGYREFAQVLHPLPQNRTAKAAAYAKKMRYCHESTEMHEMFCVPP